MSAHTSYSAAPFWGLQRKGFAKKAGLSVEQLTESPDFNTVPDKPAFSAPAAAPSAPPPPYVRQMPVIPQPAAPQNAFPSYADYVRVPQPQMTLRWPGTPAQNPSAAFANPAAYGMPYGGIQSAAIPAVPRVPQQPMPQNAVPQAPAQQTSAAYPVQYGAFPASPATGTSFPAAGSSPVFTAPYGLNNPAAAQPAVQSPAIGSTFPTPYGITPKSAPSAPQITAPQAVPAQGVPDFSLPPEETQPAPKKASPFPFSSSGQNSLPPGVQAAPPIRKLTASQMTGIFLFGLLPVVFLVSFFKTPVFYAFIALAVCGAGVVWYREMFQKVTRVIVSGLLAAMCAFGLVRLIQEDGTRPVSIPAQTVTSAVSATAAPFSADVQQPVDLLATEPPLTPEPPREQTEPERRLSGFMELWQLNNTAAMLDYVQPSWKNKQENPAQSLFTLLANRTARSYAIEAISGTETDTSRTVTMTAVIDKNTGKAASTYRFTVMMVKEGGEWYVNPNSLATNDEVAMATEEVVVNDSRIGISVTAAPRTTVTPIPPASTMLYYNPDGGNYYHTDPNCPSIRSEFLPLQGSFPYSELGTYKKQGLQPCLRCSAPVYTYPPGQ